MQDAGKHSVETTKARPQRIALTGADGMLGQMLRERAPADIELRPFTRADLDITDLSASRQILGDFAPDVIVNCAAYTRVDDCETNEVEATRINGAGPGNLAGIALQIDATLLHVSTDYVFDGRKREPYVESDLTNPLSAYGRSKLAGEQAIVSSGLEKHIIVRTSWLYGPGRGNFVETMLRLGRERDELRVVADQRGSPTYTADLADAIFCLLDAANVTTGAGHRDGNYGIYHVANKGDCTWHEFAGAILAEARRYDSAIKARSVVPITTAEFPLPAPRPAFSVLSKDKYERLTGTRLPEWRDGLKRYIARSCEA